MSQWSLLTNEERKARWENRDVSIAVIGFGYIGGAIGTLLASEGYRVVGIDKNPILLRAFQEGRCPFEEPGLDKKLEIAIERKTLSVSDQFTEIAGSDVILIVVGTPLNDEYAPVLDHLKSAVQSLGEVLEPGMLVMVKSTVPPLTTQELIRPLLEEVSGLRAGDDFGLVFSPERVDEGNVLTGLRKIPIVIGGVDTKSSDLAAEFWSRTLGVDTMLVADPTTAELVKLADNQWIDLNIALANEIALLSDEIGVDAMEVIRAANSLPKGQHWVNILYPSIGVGGYCLTKDPWFLHRFGAQRDINLQTPQCSRNVNEQMPAVTVSRINTCLRKHNKNPSQSRIAVLGLSFKNNTGDIRNTPTRPIIEMLENNGCTVVVYDPLVPDAQIRQLTTATIAPDIRAAVKDADLIACLSCHQEFLTVDLAELKEQTRTDCWFLDGRLGFDPAHVTEAGFAYTAIGGHRYAPN
jgi:nucleotide sugar dehydrogenase